MIDLESRMAHWYGNQVRANTTVEPETRGQAEAIPNTEVSVLRQRLFNDQSSRPSSWRFILPAAVKRLQQPTKNPDVSFNVGTPETHPSRNLPRQYRMVCSMLAFKYSTVRCHFFAHLACLSSPLEGATGVDCTIPSPTITWLILAGVKGLSDCRFLQKKYLREGLWKGRDERLTSSSFFFPSERLLS